MAKLIYITNTSLDGYTSDRDGNFDWTAPTAEVFAAITELVGPIGLYRCFSMNFARTGAAAFSFTCTWTFAVGKSGKPPA